jgi:hypothetical protein
MRHSACRRPRAGHLETHVVDDLVTPREWKIGSDEGTQFQQHPDGSWTSTWKNPSTSGLPD